SFRGANGDTRNYRVAKVKWSRRTRQYTPKVRRPCRSFLRRLRLALRLLLWLLRLLGGLSLRRRLGGRLLLLRLFGLLVLDARGGRRFLGAGAGFAFLQELEESR